MMQLWIVEDGHLVLYNRHGECNQCGECCCKRGIQVSMKVSSQEYGHNVHEDVLSWLPEYEGWSAIQEGEREYWFKTSCISEQERERCDAYDPETHLCTIWQDDEAGFKPVCKYWPWHPSDILPFEKCGFSFERQSPDYDCEVT